MKNIHLIKPGLQILPHVINRIALPGLYFDSNPLPSLLRHDIHRLPAGEFVLVRNLIPFLAIVFAHTELPVLVLPGGVPAEYLLHLHVRNRLLPLVRQHEDLQPARAGGDRPPGNQPFPQQGFLYFVSLIPVYPEALVAGDDPGDRMPGDILQKPPLHIG